MSNWQAQSFIDRYGISRSRCVVMSDAIRPIALGTGRFDPVPADRPIRLVYTSAADRGLNILCSVFNRICAERDDVELDVFSSYQPDGSAGASRPLGPLFDVLTRNPRVNYHGSVPNERVRDALRDGHVFAYPSTQLEASCRGLIEAMSAGLACVHPDYGVLNETAAGRTVMYQWDDDPTRHAPVFYQALTAAIRALRNGDQRLLTRLAEQKQYADEVYDWDRRGAQWETFLRGLVDLPRT